MSQEEGLQPHEIEWVKNDTRSQSRWRRLVRIIGGLVLAVILYEHGFTSVFPSVFPPTGLGLALVDWLFVLALVYATYLAIPILERPRLRRYYWRRFRDNRVAVWSLWYLAAITVLGTLGPIVVGQPQVNVVVANQPPIFLSVDDAVPSRCVGQLVGGLCHGSFAHPLGTDGAGQDILRLVLSGMYVSIMVGIVTTMIIMTIATVVGTVAAHFGGIVDEVLMRYVDLQLSFPTFFLFLLLIYLFGGSLFLMIMIFGLLSWGGVARLVRSEALQRSEEPYVNAARAAGASEWWIVRTHIVPNVSNTIITATTLTIPYLILAEAGLSFLGLGDPSVASWGQTIAAGRDDLATAWWISTIPGVFLFLTVLAMNFLGDALRDTLDPRHGGYR